MRRTNMYANITQVKVFGNTLYKILWHYKMKERRSWATKARGKLLRVGKRAKYAPSRSAGVVATACMKEEDRRNTGSPVAWSSARPTGNPRGTDRAQRGDGEARSTDEVG